MSNTNKTNETDVQTLPVYKVNKVSTKRKVETLVSDVIVDGLSQVVYQYVINNKRVNNPNFTLSDAKTLVSGTLKLGYLQWDVERYNNHDLNQWRIPAFLEFLVPPRRITITDDTKMCEDLLVRLELPDVSYEEFRDAYFRLCSALRRDPEDGVAISELRKDDLLSNVNSFFYFSEVDKPKYMFDGVKLPVCVKCSRMIKDYATPYEWEDIIQILDDNLTIKTK